MPISLLSAFEKQALRHSPETSGLKQARRHRNEYNVEYERQFSEIEVWLSSEAAEDSWQPEPSLGVLIDRVRDEVPRQDNESAASLCKNPPRSEAQRQEMLMGAMLGLSALRDRDNPKAEQAAHPLGHGQCNAQFIERYVRVLRDKLLNERLIGRKFAAPKWTPLLQRGSHAALADRARPA